MNYRLLTLLLFLLACKPSEPEIPEGIAGDTVMRDLLIDFSLAEAASNINSAAGKLPPFRPELFFEAALKQKGIDRERFITSLEFYRKNPALLEKIYDDAIAELARKQIGGEK